MTVAVARDVLPASVVNTAAVTAPSSEAWSRRPGGRLRSTTIIHCGRLVAHQKHHTGAFTVESTGSYTLIVGNAGPSDAIGPVIVTDPLPNGETFVSAPAASRRLTCTAAGSWSPARCPGPLRVGTEAPRSNCWWASVLPPTRCDQHGERHQRDRGPRPFQQRVERPGDHRAPDHRRPRDGTGGTPAVVRRAPSVDGYAVDGDRWPRLHRLSSSPARSASRCSCSSRVGLVGSPGTARVPRQS